MSCEDGICGTGGWSGPKPGDPDNNSVLTATPAFGGIDVSWTYPATNPFAVAHTVIYRGLSADFMGAIYLTTVGGNSFYDKTDIDLPLTYYYWIQLVSINGTPGSWIGPASAVARPSIERTIEQLTGKIDSEVLAQSLRTELDQISTLNTNLANEITARENSETTLAQAMADVQAGNAQALTFITNEISSRTTADTAQAENLNLVASTLGSDIAAVSTALTTDINAVTGTVNAMYTAQVNVNGLIGGFGLANNGASVDAGFDVDTFWVGRTNADKRKPFIISGGQTFIDDAAIRNASITTAKIGALQVDTLQIAGNAVTVPVAVYAGGAITIAYTGTRLAQLTITTDGSPVLLMGSATCYDTRDYLEMWFYRDASGSVPGSIASFAWAGGAGVSRSHLMTLVALSAQPAGTYTFSLVASCGTSGEAYNRTLSALMVKK